MKNETKEQVKKFNEIKEYILEKHSTHHESSTTEHFVTVKGNVHLKYYPSLDDDGEVLAFYETASNKRQEELFLEDIEEGEFDFNKELDEMLNVTKK